MELRPDDPARDEWLEQWVLELAEEGRVPQPEARSAAKPVLSRLRSSPRKLQRSIARRSQALGDRLFDRENATAGLAHLPEHEHPDRVGYLPSAWHVLPRALRYLGVSPDDVFVDFGCGKGRVVHQAAKRPFKRVIGVEISPSLAEIAHATVEAHRDRYRCRAVEIVVSDVTDFEIPDDLTIGYLFHPFKDETLDGVLARIIESIDRNPRRVRLIYVYPVETERVVGTGRFRVLEEQRSPLLDTPGSRTILLESI